MPHVFMPLRMAVTGTAQTPSIADLVILEKDKTLARLQKAIAMF